MLLKIVWNEFLLFLIMDKNKKYMMFYYWDGDWD